MRRVIIESPYRGDVEVNLAYARKALRDSLARGEAPLASHLLYPQVLNDRSEAERRMGITAGHTWVPVTEAVAFYVDLGWSEGMVEALNLAHMLGVTVEIRQLQESTDEQALSDPTQGAR